MRPSGLFSPANFLTGANSMPEKDGSFELSDSYMETLSHQLKTPISAIQSLLYAILDVYADKKDAKSAFLIEKALKRADQAREIITELSDYAFYSQNTGGDIEEIELISLLNELVPQYSLSASEKEIALQVDLPQKLEVYISGNRAGLSHAFRNILDNAIKYTPGQGRVALRLGVSENKKCTVSVEDTGSGIPEDEVDLIFEPFFRSKRHRSNTAGTGLGLPICKEIITRHGGQIRAQSAEKNGTTFTVILPYLRKEEKLGNGKPRKRVLIIGGVTAGPKVAARLRRLDEDLDITIVEKGELLSYSGCGLPFYISGRVNSPRSLMSTGDNTIRDVHFFESIKNIRVLNKTLALSIDRKKKTVRVKDSEAGRTLDLPYDVLVLATGAVPHVPDIPGIEQKGIHTLHNIEDAEAIKQRIAERKAGDVYIIGGGLVGIEAAQSLMEIGARITILEQKKHILLKLLDADLAGKLESELRRRGIKIITEANIKEIRRESDSLVIVTDQRSFYADLIILSTGVKPNSTLAKQAQLDIWKAGGILVDRHLQSSDENIYAVGDCAETVNLITQKQEDWPLGSISIKMGRIAADNICGRKTDFKGSIGTAMCKVFDINVARTGITTERAKECGFEAETITIPGLDRAHYYGDAQYIILKIIADKKSQVILGAQGFGEGDVIARISVLVCAITDKKTLDDVFKLDLGYAPAYSNPIDIVQTACLVLANKIDGLFRTITIEQFESEKGEASIIDVSPQAESADHSIPGNINIPLENIRSERLAFDKHSKIILYSKTSSRAYEAYRFLAARGYTDLRVLEGGYIYWEK